MTKLALIGCTHGYHEQVAVPECDILIHTGDCMADGRYTGELEEFLGWFERQPAKHKVLIAGNHDRIFEREPKLVRSILDDHEITYLEDSDAVIMGLTFWGSPISKRFLNWAFNRDPGEEILQHWRKIPNETDVLVTHGPPFGFLDKSNNWNEATGKKFTDNLGDRDLRDEMYRVLPRLHVFSHIHGSGGETSYIHDNGYKVILVNTSMVDEGYVPNRKPIVVELD